MPATIIPLFAIKSGAFLAIPRISSGIFSSQEKRVFLITFLPDWPDADGNAHCRGWPVVTELDR
jgi:hypothetical protein